MAFESVGQSNKSRGKNSALAALARGLGDSDAYLCLADPIAVPTARLARDDPTSQEYPVVATRRLQPSRLDCKWGSGRSRRVSTGRCLELPRPKS